MEQSHLAGSGFIVEGHMEIPGTRLADGRGSSVSVFWRVGESHAGEFVGWGVRRRAFLEVWPATLARGGLWQTAAAAALVAGKEGLDCSDSQEGLKRATCM